MRSLALIALAACGGASAFGNQMTAVDANASDSMPGCDTTISFTPAQPTAPATITAEALTSGLSGVPDYQWVVTDPNNAPVGTTPTMPGNYSTVTFDAPIAGLYTVDVRVTVMGSAMYCPDGQATLKVNMQGANNALYRLRAWPPSDLAPTQEQTVQVTGGGDIPHSITLDPGIALSGSVTSQSGGVPAYLRFMPTATPDAFVETFSASSGAFSIRALGQPHQILIVPAAPGLAPKLASWSGGTSTVSFTLDGGQTVTGTVVDGSGAALVGAQVQLAAGGVPSSLATTDSSGAFTLHAAFTSATINVDVVPPAGRGLPRLHATAAYDLTQPLAVHYANLATCNVGGLPVKRGTTSEAGAQVTIVGTLAATAGTIATGALSANATGNARIAATADGTGHLPSTLAPKAALTAVVQVAQNDLAVSALDLSACAATSVAAPAQTSGGGTIVDPNATELSGVRVDASGAGALAAAGVSPVETMSITNGAYNLMLASGGNYDVLFTDPYGRVAPLTFTNVPSGSLPSVANLPAALHIKGELAISGSANPVAGASVQVLCTSCTGVTASRPIGETATDQFGNFAVAVPDPGTM